MSKAPATYPYSQVTSIQDIPAWKKQLLGLSKDSPENSPYKWLSRQAVAKANMLEGMTFNPNMASMARAYGVPEGTDLTPYITASRTGQVAPLPPIPTQTAAQGGLMSLRKPSAHGYAGGGAPKPKPVTPQIPKGATAQQRADAINAAINNGYKPKGNEVTFLNNYADSAGLAGANVGATIDPKTGVAKPRGRNPNESSADYSKYLSSYQQAGGSLPKNLTTQYNIPKPGSASAPTVPFSQSMEIKTPYYDPTNKAAAAYGGVTDPMFQQGVDYLRSITATPSQIGQATDMFGQAASGLAGLANYSPQQVAAQQAAAQQAQATLANRGDIRDVTANKADVSKYMAAQMQAPQGVQAMGYQAAQMQGPGSWTDEGVSQKYMSPYMQGVVDIAKREKGKDYAKQLNALNAQAMSAGAFGGGRQAMERSQASKDYQQQLQDLETQGLQQAYQQGMSQYGQESALTQQARAANQQAINAQQQQYVQNALQAALNNYGGQLTAEQQNMIAKNAADQFNSQALNTANLTYEQQRLAAQQMNQGADLQTAIQNAQLATGVSQTNAQLGTQASLANAANALQAGIANQQAGLQANQQGIAAYGAMGNMAQGLGNLGLGTWQGQQNIGGMYGAAANTAINAGNTWAQNQYITGQNYWGANPYSTVTNLVNQQPAGTGSATTTKPMGIS